MDSCSGQYESDVMTAVITRWKWLSENTRNIVFALSVKRIVNDAIYARSLALLTRLKYVTLFRIGHTRKLAF